MRIGCEYSKIEIKAKINVANMTIEQVRETVRFLVTQFDYGCTRRKGACIQIFILTK